MNKQLVTSDGSFFQHPDFNELLEIARSCLTTGDVSFYEILNSAVGPVEDQIDQLTSNLIHTQGSDYLRLAYTIPVGGDGWRIGINASGLRYQLIVAPYNAATDQGSSGTLGLEASYPLIRSRLTNLYLNLAYDHKAFDNQFGGANSASLGVITGRRANDIGSSDQHFSKWRYSLSRQQVITDSLSLFAQLSGQEAGKALDSSEKFYLGGSGGVRAYPSSEGGGAVGTLGNLELRWKLPAGFILTGFYDAGHVRNNDASPGYGLKGAGAALAWQGATSQPQGRLGAPPG
jgi:hemolysin activation/secretion protein